jgi:hypothetical protein
MSALPGRPIAFLGNPVTKTDTPPALQTRSRVVNFRIGPLKAGRLWHAVWNTELDVLCAHTKLAD